ncbi:MAG: hypothetical protein GC152_10655 [Alphaproteobacteria bacterium]|nr:hypothetical protein [Alphaproteobacteria bacterium]
MTVFDWLSLSVGLYVVNIFVQAAFANRRYDPKTLLGNRDDFEPDDVHLGRARRAQANLTEAMIIFTPLALGAESMGKGDGLAAIGGAVFFVSRVAYLVIYVAGVPTLRSIVWATGMIGAGLVFWVVAPFN